MAYISFQPKDYFKTLLYTGNSSSPRTITGVGFQPDFTWIKPRNLAYSHTLVDAVRGASGNGSLSGTLISNSTGSPEGDTNSDGTITAFTSDGFTLTAGSSSSGRTNGSYNYASWNWKANGAGSSNSDGSITSTVSANTTSKFSIVKWTGTGANATIGHGLGTTPETIFVKSLVDAENWCVYHKNIGNTHSLFLNTTGGDSSNTKFWNNTSPTSTTFSVGNGGEVNGSGDAMIAYCFTGLTGFSNFGTYNGNGNADGPFVYTGFKPSLIIFKRSDSTGWWSMFNDKSLGYNPDNNALFPSSNDAENTSDFIDIVSNGFKLRDSNANLNNDGSKFLYWAWAAAPLVGSNNVPCTAR
jgi:hypothetical protein